MRLNFEVYYYGVTNLTEKVGKAFLKYFGQKGRSRLRSPMINISPILYLTENGWRVLEKKTLSFVMLSRNKFISVTLVISEWMLPLVLHEDLGDELPQTALSPWRGCGELLSSPSVSPCPYMYFGSRLDHEQPRSKNRSIIIMKVFEHSFWKIVDCRMYSNLALKLL